MKIVTIIALFVLLCCTSAYAANTSDPEYTSVWNVKDYGALGDGVTDDTSAFTDALIACRDAGGGIVFVPTGEYMIEGALTIEKNVTLKGSGSAVDGWGQSSTLLAVNKSRVFITLLWGGGIHNIGIFYPEQATEPPLIEYPYTIHAFGENCHIVGVTLKNPYNGILLKNAARHLVRDVHGYPLNIGIFVDECYDVGRIENVHFWPFYSSSDRHPTYHAIYEHIQQNATAFIFGRTDWQYVFNTFCWGYNVGYKFIETHSGSANGNFSGIGADNTAIAVHVENCQGGYGLQIVNGEFVSLLGDTPTAFVIEETNKGYISVSNSSVWGSNYQIANISGSGKVSFVGCNFINYDRDNLLTPVIEITGGDLILSSNRFGGSVHKIPEPANVYIGKGTTTAVIMGNSSKKAWTVVNESDAAIEIGLNVTDGIKTEPKSAEAKITIWQRIGNWFRKVFRSK